MPRVGPSDVASDPHSAPDAALTQDDGQSEGERRRRDFEAWCIRHVGLPWGMILSGVAAGVTYGGSLASGGFILRVALFEAGGILLGAGFATLAGRVLWRVGIGRHFATED